MKEAIIDYCKKRAILYYLLVIVKKFRILVLSWLYNEKELIKRDYERGSRSKLNLENPVRFTEKMQWLKLNNIDPKASSCADKYAVREYVTNKGFENILNEIIGTYSKPDDIPLNELPEKFVLKTTHSSGWNLICTDKRKWIKNWFWWKKILNTWLNEDYSKYYQEKHYKNITPQIICEKFIGDNKTGINDYKFFCFNGTIKMIQVDIERYTDHKQNFYDVDWNQIHVYAGVNSYSDNDLHKPKKLEEMKKISQILSEDFLHVRVDLFEWKDKIYFGELTFCDGAGYYKTEPEDFDYTMGKWLQLPI